ncbi:hypothetical protein KKE92_00055 [Candidatus Micrarchaeota archaeon]|nr:hypothetical protein [Candidatus Micrarchaeota archaeon]MBU1681964.1 hypothetical protein [Candidatus Micrarchaeota archaeon]
MKSCNLKSRKTERNSIKRAAAAVILATSLAFGCGGQEQRCPELGPVPDSGPVEPVPACDSPDPISVSCGSEPTERLLRVGDELSVDTDEGTRTVFVNDVLSDTSGNVFLEVSIYDENCEFLDNGLISQNDPQPLDSVGSGRLFSVQFGGTSDERWAQVEITQADCDLCEGETSEISGDINQGELLIAGAFKIRLDDLSTIPSNEPPSAVLSILDHLDNVLDHVEVQEDTSAVLEFGSVTMTITANEVAAGYTFGSKWADLSVTLCQN